MVLGSESADDFFSGTRGSFRIRRNDDGTKTLIKTLLGKSPSVKDISRFENELSFATSNPIPGVRKVIGPGNEPFSVELEWVEATGLDEWAEQGHSLKDKIKVASGIAAALSHLHNNGIIYRNLAPRNVLITKEGHAILIDMGLATKVVARQQIAEGLSDAANIDFISPEQTGRISRAVDYRSDLYELGAVCYWLFSGKVLYPSPDSLEKIHGHIAIHPEKLSKVVSGFPEVLSSIVSKLLSKNPENRYHSAFGVKFDFDQCLHALDDKGFIAEFELQAQDYHGELVFSNKIYGRKHEIQQLNQDFERSVHGEKTFVTVTGYSGIGKTAVVHELYEPVFRNRGMLISGKFERYQRDVPYLGFKDAFREFIKNISALDSSQLAAWKDTIHNATYPVGRVLADLLPDFEFLIGEQPELPELNGPEAQNRFNYVILSFIKAIAVPGNPLVIFMDDIQWADAASLQLLKRLLGDPDLKNLMLICAYRDYEVNADHTVTFFLEDLEKQNIHPSKIHLDNLTLQDVAGMLSDILQTEETEIVELTEIIHKKSQGNALFVNQFLKAARQDENIVFDFEAQKWTWNKEKILALSVAGGVEELLAAAVERLPDETKHLLTLGSSFGNSFTSEHLSALAGVTTKALRTALQPALISGLILPYGAEYYFTHDKVQQVLLDSVSAKELAEIHLRIARALSQETETGGEAIFNLVNHWNKCRDLITDPLEKLKIAELNFEAGHKARASVAFKEALQFFQNALYVLPENHWETYYEISLKTSTFAAEAAYLSGSHELSEMFVNQVVKHSRSTLDKGQALIYRIRAYTAENKMVEAIDSGYEILSELGVKLPQKPGKLATLFGLVRAGIALKSKSAESILALPEMEDKRVLLIMDVLFNILSPAYFAKPELLPIVVFRMIRFTLKYGLNSKSPYVFIGFGYIHSAYLGNIELGTKYGHIGFSMHQKLEGKALASSVHNNYYGLTNHWTMHLPETIPGLREGFRAGLETGDIEFTSYAAHSIVYHSYFGGRNLEETLDEGIGLLRQIETFNLEIIQERIGMFLQSIFDLIHRPESPGLFHGEHFDEAKIKLEPVKQNHIYFHNLYFQKCVTALIYGENEKAWNYLSETTLYIESVLGSALYSLFHFYRPLCIAGIYKNHPEKQRALRGLMRKDLKKLKKYMKHSPKTYGHKYWLVAAEFARMRGESEKAQTYYFTALRQARRSQMSDDEAMTWERAGEFYLEQGQNQIADFYLNNAYLSYRHWGAHGKIEQLEERYPQLAGSEGTGQHHSDDLDLATVVKAYNAITSEIVMSRLLERLMQIMLENAGAQRGVLVREVEGYRSIIAVMDKQDSDVEVMLDEPVNTSQRLSHTVLNVTANSDTFLVLENAMETRPYNTENYIREHEVKSVICMPVVQKGKHFGYLYLENNAVTGAFNKSRISLLKILSAQAAVSLENAELYEEMSGLNSQLKSEIFEKEEAQKALLENERRLEEYNATLEEKVAERTNEISVQKDLIEKEKQKSDDLLLNILPEETAEELKRFGKAVPRRYPEVTVLFTDFVKFSEISENVAADVLVNEINFYYSKFDEIITNHKLEKIKTIGDSYMCAGGLPLEMPDHAERTVQAAIEIRNFVSEQEEKRKKEGKVHFQIRVGLHTGPVIAGIVGIKKFAYDIWGDTVNYASRMESGGEQGKVNISGSTYEKVKDKFACEYRGKVAVKSKGEIDMYFVESL